MRCCVLAKKLWCGQTHIGCSAAADDDGADDDDDEERKTDARIEYLIGV